MNTGAWHIIPYSSIITFANFARGIGSFVANYGVGRQENIDRANQLLRNALDELMGNEEIHAMAIGEPSMVGVVGLGNQAFTVRVSFTIQALLKWAVRFTLDVLVNNHFAAAGIRPPYQAVRIVNNAPAPVYPSAAAAAVVRLLPPA